MAEKVDPLRRLFLEISQQISVEEQRSLYGLVKDKQIPTKALEGLADANELFIKLEELGCIGNENLTLLKELLGSIKREPLVRLVEEFERKQQKNQSISQQPGLNRDKHSKCIFLAERWSRVGDTVSALNCQLASLAAQNRQKKICCVALKATEEEKKDATDCGVELILPCLSEDIIDLLAKDEPGFKWLLSPHDYFSTLTRLQNVEYIVEHVESSTSFLCSSVLRKRCFKDADIILINHAIPSADLRDKYLKFAEVAAAAFSVGPAVFEEYKNFMN
ncbi:uncharacterized protein [Ptychodera flava]|uniref:uncharacterized protein n=1 Tax=Ptychodera flava TaxID=63121 RepID=UPI00396AA0BB